MMTFKQFINDTQPDIHENRYSMAKADPLSDPVTLRLPKTLLKQIDEAAVAQNITRAAYVRLSLHRSIRYLLEGDGDEDEGD